MGKLTGVKTLNTANGLRRGTLHAERNATGRIVTVSLTCEGIGYISFAHLIDRGAKTSEANAAERLESLRGAACPMSAVRIRRYERGNVDAHAATPGIDV